MRRRGTLMAGILAGGIEVSLIVALVVALRDRTGSWALAAFYCAAMFLTAIAFGAFVVARGFTDFSDYLNSDEGFYMSSAGPIRVDGGGVEFIVREFAYALGSKPSN